jgi:hypothetical protein
MAVEPIDDILEWSGKLSAWITRHIHERVSVREVIRACDRPSGAHTSALPP